MSKLKYYEDNAWHKVNGQITGDTLPIGSEVDFDGETVPVGWQEIDNPDAYSTSEIKTNKVWIDGKPIYRKVIDIGNLPNNTRKTMTLGLSNIETITDIKGIASKSNGNDWVSINLLGGITLVLYRISNDTLFIDTTGDYSEYEAIAVFEYTKTTD